MTTVYNNLRGFTVHTGNGIIPIDQLTDSGVAFIRHTPQCQGTTMRWSWIDNSGNLWATDPFRVDGIRPNQIKKIKNGINRIIPDECIRKIQTGEWILSTAHDGNPEGNCIEKVHSVFITYVSMYIENENMLQTLIKKKD